MKAKGAAVLAEAVEPENLWAWSAYMSLRGSRHIVFGGVGPIPVSEVLAYCELVGLRDTVQRMRLARFIRALDQEELEWLRSH